MSTSSGGQHSPDRLDSTEVWLGPDFSEVCVGIGISVSYSGHRQSQDFSSSGEISNSGLRLRLFKHPRQTSIARHPVIVANLLSLALGGSGVQLWNQGSNSF